MKAVLGIDLGTSFFKIGLVDAAGQIENHGYLDAAGLLGDLIHGAVSAVLVHSKARCR